MRPRDALAAATLYTVALAVRLTPLLLSPLPYNIDGFAQAHLAQEIAAGGHWSLDQDRPNAYNLKMPVLPVLLAILGETLGLDPLTFAQMLMALVGALAVPGAYLVARALAAPRAAALGACTFLAFSGTFVFLTSSTMKEAVGLALLPLALCMFVKSEDLRRRGLAIFFLALMPFLHNLTTAMALAFLAALVVEEHVAAHWRHELRWRRAFLDGALISVLTAAATLYYRWVNMEFLVDLLNGEDLALLLSVAFVFTLLAVALASRQPGRPILALGPGGILNGKGVVILAIGLLVLANRRRSLFPGTVTTSPTLLLVTVAYLPLALLGLVGFELARGSGSRCRTAVVAMILPPLGAMVFAILRGLDPLSFVLLYRSFDFLDFGFALSVGMAATSSAARVLGGKAVPCLVVACLLLTLPAAFATQETFGVVNATSPAEFAALGSFASLPAGSRDTDQRYADILAFYWSEGSSRSLPLDLAGGREPNAAYLLVSETWATRGAQVYPMPNVVVRGEDLSSLVESRDVIYANSAGLLLMMSP